MSNNTLVCPHCTNRDPSLIEVLYQIGAGTRYWCNVCAHGWTVPKETPNEVHTG